MATCRLQGLGIRSNNNVVYRCTYHVVWCPKYRRDVSRGPVDDRLKQIIREVCTERDAPTVEPETMPGHVHLLVTVDPQYGIHRQVDGIRFALQHTADPGSACVVTLYERIG